MTFDWRTWLWRVVGASLIGSGIVNMLGIGEDIPAVFASMEAANAGTRLAPLSDLIAAHARPVIVPVALFMGLSGLGVLVEWRGRRLVCAGLVVMLLAFITLLHRAFPEVIFADGLYLAALAALLGGPQARRGDGAA